MSPSVSKSFTPANRELDAYCKTKRTKHKIDKFAASDSPRSKKDGSQFLLEPGILMDLISDKNREFSQYTIFTFLSLPENVKENIFTATKQPYVIR